MTLKFNRNQLRNVLRVVESSGSAGFYLVNEDFCVFLKAALAPEQIEVDDNGVSTSEVCYCEGGNPEADPDFDPSLGAWDVQFELGHQQGRWFFSKEEIQQGMANQEFIAPEHEVYYFHVEELEEGLDLLAITDPSELLEYVKEWDFAHAPKEVRFKKLIESVLAIGIPTDFIEEIAAHMKVEYEVASDLVDEFVAQSIINYP